MIAMALTLPAPASADAAPKMLRVTVSGSESGFDPAQISDVASGAIISSLFDAPLTYDYPARPARLKANTTTGLPEANANHTHFVFQIKPGITFSEDPAFTGQRRELAAADCIYTVKRYYDPKTRSPTLFHYQNAGLLRLSEKWPSSKKRNRAGWPS